VTDPTKTGSAAVDVEIRYCAICGLLGRAQRLADRIRSDLGIEARIVPGALGQFDVFADGVHIVGRKGGLLNQLMHTGWPDEADVVAWLRQHSASKPAA
jgi:predicted Rdx family selenoprotein